MFGKKSQEYFSSGTEQWSLYIDCGLTLFKGMEYGNIIEKEQNKFDLIFKVKRKYENTNESTTWVSINERKRVSALYKEQEYNFIPKYSEIYEIGSETFVDDVTVAAEKMAQKIYDYYYM